MLHSLFLRSLDSSAGCFPHNLSMMSRAARCFLSATITGGLRERESGRRRQSPALRIYSLLGWSCSRSSVKLMNNGGDQCMVPSGDPGVLFQELLCVCVFMCVCACVFMCVCGREGEKNGERRDENSCSGQHTLNT